MYGQMALTTQHLQVIGFIMPIIRVPVVNFGPMGTFARLTGANVPISAN